MNETTPAKRHRINVPGEQPLWLFDYQIDAVLEYMDNQPNDCNCAICTAPVPTVRQPDRVFKRTFSDPAKFEDTIEDDCHD